MIQFNLLPDIKKQYIKAKKTKNLIVSVSVIVGSVSIGIVVFMFIFVNVFQKKNINDLSSDIQKGISSIKSVEGLDGILTVQNQLAQLPQLHDVKPITSRIFNYLVQVKPTTVTINSFEIDYEGSTIKIVGNASSIADVNQFADTLKFASYSTEDAEAVTAFPTVSTTVNRTDKSTSYSLLVTFDPMLFNVTKTVSFIIPSQITTRSEITKPNLDELNKLFEPTAGGQ